MECIDCHEDLAEENFSVHKTRGRQACCKLCMRLRVRKHYVANRPYYTEKARRNKLAIRDHVRKLKEEPCSDCGITYPYYVMDFDHREGEEKLGNVSRMIATGGSKQAREEIAKCDVVCANCHRERTHQRLSASSSVDRAQPCGG